MIKAILAVGIGSFCGGALRYLISALVKSASTTMFPLGTLLVNLLGCLLLGTIIGLFSRYNTAPSTWSLMLSTGLCGGFTTFSTFANESLQLLQNGHHWIFIIYVGLSIVVGIVMVALGFMITR